MPTPDAATVARFTERVRAERRHRRLRWATWLGVVAALAGCAVLVQRSSLLSVAKVEVAGQQRVTLADVRAAAGIAEGGRMTSVDIDEARRRLEALPPVHRAYVWRDWPRTVRIRIVEREPAAAIRSGDGFLLVDAGGAPIARVAKRPKRLVIVSLAPDAPPVLVRDALHVVAALPVELRGRIASIKVASPDGLELRTDDGDTVVWGSAEQSDRKAAVLAVLLTRPGSRYDVSAPDSPAYK